MQMNPKMIQQIQAKLARIQEQLGNETVEATVGGGAITVTMTGHQDIRSIKISPDVVDPDDIEMLEDLIVAAINEATNRSRDLATKRLGAVTGGLKIPGLF